MIFKKSNKKTYIPRSKFKYDFPITDWGVLAIIPVVLIVFLIIAIFYN